jgi:transposase
VVADVPRVRCEEHGVVTTSVPWAEPGSGFTAVFEALVIDWLKEASISAVSRLMVLSWNAVDGIMQRAVVCRGERNAVWRT